MASYRERILAQLKANFERVVAGQPTSDPYAFAWDSVSRSELGDWAKGKAYVLTIIDEDETKRQEASQTRVEMPVYLEWQAQVPKGTEPSTHANQVLAEIERRIGDDPYLREDVTNEQLALNCWATNTSLDRASFTTSRVSGTVTLMVSFRHGQRDPRAYV